MMRIQRNRQFYCLLVEGEISTIFLESKMAFKRLILVKLIYVLRTDLKRNAPSANKRYTKTSIHQSIIHRAESQEQPERPKMIN